MIKIVEDEFYNNPSHPGLYGWWYINNHLINITSDGGPGDHMGFIYASDHYKELGLSREAAYSLEYFYYMESLGKEIKDLDPADPYELKLIHHLSGKPDSYWINQYEKTMNYIHQNFIRVLYSKQREEIIFQIPDHLKDIQSLKEIDQKLPTAFDISHVSIETWSGNVIVIDASYSDFYDSRSLRDLSRWSSRYQNISRTQ